MKRYKREDVERVLRLLPSNLKRKDIAALLQLNETTVSNINCCYKAIKMQDADYIATLQRDSRSEIVKLVAECMGYALPAIAEVKAADVPEQLQIAEPTENAKIVELLERIARSTSYIANYIYKQEAEKNNA